MNKKVNGENADNNNTKSSSSTLNRLQVNEIYTDTYTKVDRRFTSQIKNDNCQLTLEKNNKLSLEQIHLNKTKILNMEICKSNAENTKIAQIGSTKSSEKSCPSSSDELYQVIRSKIDRVLSGCPSFTHEKAFGNEQYLKTNNLNYIKVIAHKLVTLEWSSATKSWYSHIML